MQNLEYYYNWDLFANIYLEDSYILEIIELSHTLVFKVDIILTEKHPMYHIPNINEQYCYQIGFIEFHGISQINWSAKNLNQISIDLDGVADFGNIDMFYKDNDTYYIEGDFGNISLLCDELVLNWGNAPKTR